MRSAPILLPALAVALCGCGNMAYQTRYIPVSAESVYSPAEQMTWSGDKEVYELPANPPAIDEAHRARVDCRTPGQKFKPVAVAGIEDRQKNKELADPSLIARLNDDPEPGSPFGPQKDYPVAAYYDAEQRGAREPIGLVPVGVGDQGPFPFRGSGTLTIPASPVAAYRTDQIDWCTSHEGSLANPVSAPDR
jgi:hypothetical protein